MSTLLLVFVLAALGYLVGRVEIFGLRLAASGVLLVSLVFGHFGFELPSVVRELGLVCFVTAVGLIAGPVFIETFKAKAGAFILLGMFTVLFGAGLCVVARFLFDLPTPLVAGIFSGALTSTPGLAAAVEATGSDLASVGYGIAYPFGVIGVVLFVQLIPRITRTAANTVSATKDEQTTEEKKRFEFDPHGMFIFALAAVLGLLLGSIRIPLPGGASFALGSSGGPLITGLIFGGIGHIGRVELSARNDTCDVLREFGLALFLMGAGVNAGAGFIDVLREHGAVLFLVGAVITLLPMIASYFLARLLMKLSVFQSLGAICGGMTSTPALGALIQAAKSDSVAAAYAATYPIALIFVVLCSQFMAILL